MAKLDLTLSGLPVQHWISTQREADAVAMEVIEGVQGAAERKPGDVWATLALLVVQWHATYHRPLSAKAVNAMRAALAPALDSPKVKARLELPSEVSAHEMSQVMLAAQLDGEADAAGGAKLHREALGAAMQVSGRTIDAWRKQQDYLGRREFIAKTAVAIEPPVPRGPKPQGQWIRDREKARPLEADNLRVQIARKARRRIARKVRSTVNGSR